jgi:ABC-type nitrate/sulfonate/bicarbonate transport system substrate-binding protein
LLASTTTFAAGKGPEKEQIKLGFIKLTDMAPLAIAYEKGFFEDEGLYVTLEPQANWKVVLDRVITGELDGSHMLAGQPLGASIGIGTKADLVTAFAHSLGARVEWHNDSEAALFEKLEKFELDVVVGGLTADNPWAVKVGFTRPYVEADGKGHVVAVAPGENRLLVEIERALRAHAAAVAARVGGKPVS